MQTLLRDMLPKVNVPVGPPDIVIQPTKLFQSPVREIWMEIGFGAGEHLAWQAEKNRDVGFIGCEPYMNGVASLLRHAKGRDLSNIRILPDDARPLLDRLPDECLTRLFVLFPDPWPKRRHHDRRIVQRATLDKFIKLLVPGGELRLATDDPQYLRWILVRTTGRSDLIWRASRPRDWRIRPDDWPRTRYEAKAVEEGRCPAFLCFQKPN